MRFALSLVAGVGFALLCPAAHGEPPEKPAAKAPKLALGDAAPPLQVSKWLQGDEVKHFEPGKVYVVEFWATWCGPCIGVMPLLASLQAEYRDKGLTVIGVASKDDMSSVKGIEGFVAKKGKRHGYTFAYCDDRKTYEAYMTAAGMQGIPTAFVIGPTGKIEFIGHAMELDLVIPKVMDGSWRGLPDIDAIRKEHARIGSLFWKKVQTDPAGALKEFDSFEADHPKVAAGYYYQIKKLQILVVGKRFDDARELTESLIRTAVATKNTVLIEGVQLTWTFQLTNPDKKHPELALKVAEAGLRIEGDLDPVALSNVAEAHAFAGNKDRAAEFARKAIAAAPEDERERYETALKKLLGK
jgi:thiol-disulfide isomerase/thioredoxin